jgi:hypothetical protein
LFPPLFFGACLAVIGLIGVLIRIGGWEAGIREHLSLGSEAARAYTANETVLAKTLSPVTPGLAWRACRTYLIFMCAGLFANICGWRTAKKFWAVAAAAAYACALIRMPEMWLGVLPALIVALISMYALIMERPRPKSGSASARRR